MHGRRILVLEDEGLVAMHMEDLLCDLGCEVVGPISTVDDAIATLGGETIDAALLDVNLGDGTTSYPVAARLRQTGVPFAFVTGYGAKGLDEQFRTVPVLSKPVDEAKLYDMLNAMFLAN
jgi:CheY-like chemotaxis protein